MIESIDMINSLKIVMKSFIYRIISKLLNFNKKFIEKKIKNLMNKTKFKTILI